MSNEESIGVLPIEAKSVISVPTCIWAGVAGALEYEGTEGGCCLIHSRSFRSLVAALTPIDLDVSIVSIKRMSKDPYL
jgi:hypothetical protein